MRPSELVLRRSLSILVLALVSVSDVRAQEGRNQNMQQPTAGATRPSEAPSAAQTSGAASDLIGLMDSFDYDPRGRRDPFVQPIPDRPVPQGVEHGPSLPLQKFDLGQLSLVGIIWDVRKPKAMIKDPTGVTHIVGPNTKLGPRNGYIAVIREGEIVVVETIDRDGRLLSTAQVVKIAK